MDKKEPLVSIIIPTFGRPLLLKKAIESVLSQNYKSIEIIVVDDNDTNSIHRTETEKIMVNYKNTPQVFYEQHEYNKNGAAARNTGLTISKGSYICFLDDDDYFLPGKISEQVNFLENKEQFEAVYCGWLKNGKEYFQKFEGKLTLELLLMDYQPITPTIMFRRESILDINGFDEKFKRHQDYELMIRFFDKYTISYVDKCLVGLGENEGENALYGEKLEELKTEYLSKFSTTINTLDKEKPGTKNKIYAKHYSRVFLSHLNHKYFKLATNMFFYQIKSNPFNFINEVFHSTTALLKIKLQN